MARVISQIVVVILFAATAVAQELPPELTQPVNDFAHVIDAQSAQTIESLIRSLQQASGDVVVVATVPTFKPYADIREYAVKMFENWKFPVGFGGCKASKRSRRISVPALMLCDP